MKRQLSLIMSIIMIVTFCVFPVQAIVPGEVTVPGCVDDERVRQVIELVDPYVLVNGNALALYLPSEVRSELTDSEFLAIQDTFELINTELDNGTLAVTANGTLYVAGDTDLLVQGGNVNKVTWHWWGVRRYASRAKANQIAHVAQNCSVATATAVTVALSLVGASGAAGLAAGLISMFTSARLGMISNSIYYVNGLTTRGVIIDLRWFVTYNVVSQ